MVTGLRIGLEDHWPWPWSWSCTWCTSMDKIWEMRKENTVP